MPTIHPRPPHCRLHRDFVATVLPRLDPLTRAWAGAGGRRRRPFTVRYRVAPFPLTAASWSAQGGSRAAQPPSGARAPLTRPSTPTYSRGGEWGLHVRERESILARPQP